MLSSDGGWSRFAREDGGRNAVSGGFRAAIRISICYTCSTNGRDGCVGRRHGRARGSRLPGGMRVRILRYTSNRKRRWPENLAGMRGRPPRQSRSAHPSRQALEREVPMTIGSPFARPWRDGANILRTLLSLLLSCALALSLAPSAAWAASGEVGDAAVGDVPAPAVPSDGQPAAQADESPAPDDPALILLRMGRSTRCPLRQTRARPEALREEAWPAPEAAGGPGEGSGAPDVADGREGSAASAENARTLDAVVSQNASSLGVVPPRRSRQAASPRSRPRRPRRALRFLPDSNMREPPCMRAPGNPARRRWATMARGRTTGTRLPRVARAPSLPPT